MHFTEAEIQIITTLAWFRSRYALFLDLELDRKADLKSIEEFGSVWIGRFKRDWNNAFDSLLKKEVLTCSKGEYQFTSKGERIKKEIETQTPFFKYEYDHFFDSDKNSKAHSIFCERVYGKDLSQHGLIDMDELSILIDKLSAQQPSSVADIGCGNGRITEYISEKVQGSITGIDISPEGIALANDRTSGNSSLQFIEGNLNQLDLGKKYDAVLFLDTLYYADDLKYTIEKAIHGLNSDGCVYAYFSQWIMDLEYSKNLDPTNTHLAQILNDLGLVYTYTDLTISGIHHWKKKLQVLEEMKMDFEEEGSMPLWEYRYREAHRYANWGDDKYARYLYEIRK